MMDIKEDLLLWFIIFVHKKSKGSGEKSAGSGVNMHTNNLAMQKLTEELHNPIIRKFKKEQFIQDSERMFVMLI